MDLTRDVVVIGAGAAGTMAGVELARAGLSVAVLEARGRVGGRLFTETVDGVTLEMGGQWISPDQDAVIDVIADLGLTTFARYRDGESIYVTADGAPVRFTGEVLPVPARTRDVLVTLTRTLDELAAGIDPERPWDSPDAAALDRISFGQWIAEHTDDAEAADNVALYIGPMMLAKPAHSFSMLNALLMAASIGSFTNLVDADYVLDRRVVGGLQQVPIRLAERLGDDVFLGRPVRALKWGDGGVEVVAGRPGAGDATGAVEVADGADLTVRARHAILAHAPVLYDRISFDPPLPARRQQMHQHLSMGSVIKVQAVYDTPFWRAEGLSGTAFSPYQVCHETYDNTEPGNPHGVMVAFVAGVNADEMYALSAASRRQRLLGSLASYFGPRAMEPIAYRESAWDAEEWTRGAYDTSFDLGGLTRYGADLRGSVGPIHFACSDIAGIGYMHVDGAIRRGRAVAAEIVAACAERDAGSR